MSSGSVDREELRRALLELLRSDWEFRRAVAAELGLLEILERLEKIEERIEEHTRAIRALHEQVAKQGEAIRALQEQMVKLQEQVAKQGEAIRALQEQMIKLQEQVARQGEAIRALEEQMIRLQEEVARHGEAIERLQEQVVRLDHRLTALGARWGMYAEAAVRDFLYRVLQEYLGVARVEKWRSFDEEGRVLGCPAVVEIDVVVKDDTHYLVEVKSSLDKYDVYVFNKKCEFYVEKTGPRRTKKIMVTFFAEDPAREAARELGVEIVTA